MNHAYRRSVAVVPILGMLLAVESAPSAAAGATQASYEDFLDRGRRLWIFQRWEIEVGVPDYSVAAMARQFRRLREFQRRLTVIETSRWPIHEQVDHGLVRTEINGFELQRSPYRATADGVPPNAQWRPGP